MTVLFLPEVRQHLRDLSNIYRQGDDLISLVRHIDNNHRVAHYL